MKRGLGLAACVLSLVPQSLACGAADSEALGNEEAAFVEGPALAYDSYEVLFTNPECGEYAYSAMETVVSESGARLTTKTRNAYCSKADAAASGARESSPQKRLIDWIRDPSTKEIFFAYLSFSNNVLSDALCEAIRDRHVRVTFVLDRDTGLAEGNRVKACGAALPVDQQPRFELRGHDATIGYAHNKVFMINPDEPKTRIVFSSGNASSGLVTHHENWHFLTVPRETHFAGAHVCMRDGMLDHYATKREYIDFVKTCRDALPKGEEKDLKTFFVPGDGGRAGNELRKAVRSATSIRVAAHRFSYRLLRDELAARLDGASPPEVRFVSDDDLYWAGHQDGVASPIVFPNTNDEWGHVNTLVMKGMKARYVETNHLANQLHHNKFMVFEMPTGDAVFTGAGNFTGTAFTDNFENFYFITIPHVVEAMKAQHEHLFEKLATAPEDLPARILPATRR